MRKTKHLRWILLTLLVAAATAVAMVLAKGVGTAHDDVRGVVWGSSTESGSVTEWLNRNSYMTLSQYPGYGIAIYNCDSGRNDSRSDAERMRDAMAEVRHDFRDAFAGGRLMRWGRRGERLPFAVNFVFLILDDRRKPEYCGLIVDANSLFGAKQGEPVLPDEREFIRGRLIVREPEPPGAYSPETQYRLPPVERHMDARLDRSRR